MHTLHSGTVTGDAKYSRSYHLYACQSFTVTVQCRSSREKSKQVADSYMYLFHDLSLMCAAVQIVLKKCHSAQIDYM